MPLSPSWQFALSTPATRFAMGGGRTSRTGTRKRRKKKAAAPRRRAKKRAAPKRAKKGNKFVKGSAAARRHMAKLRKMRK